MAGGEGAGKLNTKDGVMNTPERQDREVARGVDREEFLDVQAGNGGGRAGQSQGRAGRG